MDFEYMAVGKCEQGKEDEAGVLRVEVERFGEVA